MGYLDLFVLFCCAFLLAYGLECIGSGLAKIASAIRDRGKG